jgi:predicted dehydrogenase
MKQIRVGVIGANPERGWAADTHLPVLQLLPQFELAAVCTTRQESADASAKKFGARFAFTDPAALARHPEVDLVAVSVRVPEHHRLVRLALEAGKHVYCEWPLGRDTREAEELAALAQQKGVLNVIGLQGRMSPELNCMADLVAEGYVGEVLSCTMLASNLTWGGVVPAASRFILDRANAVTVLSITTGHTLDALCQVLGEFRDLSAEVASRRSEVTLAETGERVAKNAPDQVAIVGTLGEGPASGAVATVHVRAGLLRGGLQLFEVHGTKGDLALAADGPLGMQNALLTLRGTRDAKQAPALLEIPAKYRHVPDSTPKARPYNVAQLYARIAARLNGAANVALPDFALALRRHRLLDAVQRASDSGRRERVDA